MTLTRAQLLEYMRRQRFVAQASVNAAGAPQAAVIGVVVNERFEVFFDTLGHTRKAQNLRRDPRVAFVIGGWEAGDHRTVQYEGVVDEPTGAELARWKELYFASFADGREREAWPGIAYFRARPTWIRYGDFTPRPPLFVEFGDRELR